MIERKPEVGTDLTGKQDGDQLVLDKLIYCENAASANG